MPGPDIQVAGLVEALALLSEGILVDGDGVLVGQDTPVSFRHMAQVIPGQQWCGEQHPQAHVGAVLILGHFAVADLQHVRIVPVPGPGEAREARLAESDSAHARVGVVDVIRRAPHAGAHRRPPLPRLVQTVLAQAIKNGTPGPLERGSHFPVSGNHQVPRRRATAGLAHLVLEITQVILEKINTPGRVLPRVLLLVAEAPGVAGAGLRSRRGVDPKLQPLGVNVVTECLHIGKALIRMQHALRIAFSLPGVVDIDVDIAGVAHTGTNQRICGSTNIRIGHVAGEMIPTIPPHGWRGLCKTTGRRGQ